MTYHEALVQVKPFIEQHGNFAVVARGNAAELMGAERFGRFLRDKIIGVGPSGYDGFYFWNVAAGMVKAWENFK